MVARSALPCHVVGFHSGLQILSWNEVGSRKFLPSPYALIGPMLGHFGEWFCSSGSTSQSLAARSVGLVKEARTGAHVRECNAAFSRPCKGDDLHGLKSAVLLGTMVLKGIL